MRLPWQASIVLGIVVFVGLKWILPTLWSSNKYLKVMATGISGMAWVLASIFLLIGIAAFFVQISAATKAAPNLNRPDSTRNPIDVGWGKSEPGASIGRESFQEPLKPSTSRSEAFGISRPTEWSLELIRDIEWKRFEDLCHKFYESIGIRSETTSLGADGGVDIRLYQDVSGQATSIVQCKAWTGKPIGVQLMRELRGVMAHENIGRGIFMTCGRFSDEAREFANSNSIAVIDGEKFLMMIERLSAEAQNKLLAFATAGDYTTPTCSHCGIMMRRVPGMNGKPDFWGCGNFPRCRQKIGMRRANA